MDTSNLSPKQLSFITASIISVVNTILAAIILPSLKILIIVFASTFIITYFLYYYTLQYFIYRKIKLIYKFISLTKATKREEFFFENVLPQKSIEEVSEDVQRWAIQRKDEIEILQKNEQFRKEFLMNLAHELRTPIFTIQGYVETLVGGALEDPSVNRKFLNSASKGIDRLVQLVDDLDEISRLESGNTPLQEEKFLIYETIRDVYEEFALQAKEKQINLDIKKGTDRTLVVYADKPKIRQVLTNLVENALKYSHEGGNIIASCDDTDETQAYIEIEDNGPGIPEEHLPRIFERFYRADRSRNRNIGGTGLGLAIVKHIIEAHGQTVNVRSKPGVGSSFGFTLAKG